MCKKSGTPGQSSSFDGSPVHLFLLRKGKVIEHMHGNYDSYGRVFSDKKDPKDTSLTPTTSFEWKLDWNKCCDLMFDKDKSNGLALIHDRYWHEGDPYPTERSDDDPNQGWGNDGELMGDTSENLWKKVEKPYHIYDVSKLA